MNDELLTLVVREIITETRAARTLVLQPADGRSVPYRPGQFLTFLLHRGGRDLRRSYSLSSVPGLEPDLRITIKRVENGEISRFLLDHLRVGDELTSLYPTGRFVLETRPDTARDIILFGAGSGIAPLYGLLRQALRDEPRSRVTLLYSNTRPREVIYRAALRQLQEQYPDRFRLIHLLSQTDEDTSDLGGTVRAGRLSNLLLETLLPTLFAHPREQALFYLCGPPDYMRMVQFTLVFAGIAPEQIRKEIFVTESLGTPPPPVDARARRVQIRFRQTDYTVEVAARQPILQAALEQGIALPYSCRGGRCSACALRCRSGTVRMTINEVLTERDLAEGWVLSCTGYPDKDDVVLEA